MKIIPAIDLMDSKVVRLVKGNPKQKTIYSDDPVGVAKKWEEAGADRIHLVDLDATLGLGSNLEIIQKITKAVSTPIQVGGGFRSESAIKEALEIASQVVLGTFAFKNKETLPEILEKFGKERFVISVDQFDGVIVIDGWTQSTGIKLTEGIRDFSKMGFSEFLLTSVDRDGTLQGPDINSLKQACEIEDTKIIASGGISGINDIAPVRECGVFGVILGKALYDGKISIEEAKAT